MKVLAYVMGVIFALVLVVGGSLLVGYISANNEGAQMENLVVQMDKQSENRLSTYTMKIQEMVQVPEMYISGLKDVIKGTFEGRYGKDGSKAVMQWIQEQNIPVDSKVFLNLQTEIGAGREEFAIAQARKLEVCTTYQNNLDYFWKGMFLKWAGYPKKDMSKLCQVVSDATTQEAFAKGVQKPLSLGAK